MKPDHLRRVRRRWSDGDAASALRCEVDTERGPLILLVVSRKGAEAGIGLEVPFALISISNPGSSAPSLPPDDLRMEVLTLHFHDSKFSPGDPQLREHVRPITAEQASQVSSFVVRCLPRVQAFAVHCDHAMSRSPAVAAAISAALGGDRAFFFEHRLPNARVFRLVHEALKRDLPA